MKKFYLPVFLTLFTSAAFAQVYVTPTGAGSKDGTSWTNSYDGTQLQTAINSAASGTQVWVAAGTYTPTVNPVVGSTDARDKAFLMKRGVSVYGGFAGNETGLLASINRDFVANKTILSGDLSGNDIVDFNNPGYVALKADNSYHVVIISDNDAVSEQSNLDGFTIFGGYASVAGDVTISSLIFSRNRGAGINSRGSGAYNLQYRNLIIEHNVSASWGGGAMFFTSFSMPYELDKVSFTMNRGSTGGGLYISRESGTPSFNFTDATFEDNEATLGNAGAIYHASSGTVLTISNNSFLRNKAKTAGGAVYITTGKLDIKSSKFQENIATTTGGAIHSVVEVTISSCKFDRNTAATGGGAIYSSTSMNLQNSDFRSNTTDTHGGAIYMTSTGTGATDTKIINSSFSDNIANGSGNFVQGGGAIIVTYVTNTTKLTAINNTFYANKSPNSIHGAMALNADLKVSVNLYNNIFNGNTGTAAASGDVRQTNVPVLDFQNNLFQVFSQVTSGNDTFVANMIDAVPASLFASTTATDFNFLYPTSTSVVINQGNNALYSTVGNIATDKHLGGYARLEGTNIDMGAIEFAAVLPVKISTFNAKLANGRTQLNWTVGTEDNVTHYEVERSNNGVDFTKIAVVTATKANKYTTLDGAPQIGLNYYRLKTIDNDGKFSFYGSIQSVKVNALANAGVKVYPNPIKGNKVSVSMNGHAAGTYHYKLVNGSGAIAQQGPLVYDGNTDISLTINVPAGLYVLQLNNGSVTIQTKLIKQ